jgi:hypothetical protein
MNISTILVIFSCFQNTNDVIVSNIKKNQQHISFEELSFQSTLIRNYFYLLIKSGCSRYNGQMFDNKKKTGKGSGHNEYHEKVNKCKTLVEKDT